MAASIPVCFPFSGTGGPLNLARLPHRTKWHLLLPWTTTVTWTGQPMPRGLHSRRAAKQDPSLIVVRGLYNRRMPLSPASQPGDWPLTMRDLLREILANYALPWFGTHGVSHWARVLETGLRLAPGTGANPQVIQLFAVLHDSKRINEGIDPDHGRRAADYAARLRGSLDAPHQLGF